MLYALSLSVEEIKSNGNSTSKANVPDVLVATSFLPMTIPKTPIVKEVCPPMPLEYALYVNKLDKVELN